MLYQPYEPAAADAQVVSTAGTVANDNTDGLGTAWTNPGNAKGSNDSYATCLFDNPLATSYSQILKATNFGFGLGEDVEVAGILATVEASYSGGTAYEPLMISEVFLSIGGVVVDEDLGYLTDNRGGYPAFVPTADKGLSFGGFEDRWGLPGGSLTPAVVNNSGFGFGIRISGRCTGRTARVDGMGLIIGYTKGEGEDRLCFAGRSIELASDGVSREHRTDDVWGPLTPDGFLPTDTPGGSSGKPSRGILIPTRGDFADLPDSGTNPLSAVVKTRAGHLYARGGDDSA